MKKLFVLSAAAAMVLSGCADPNFQMSNHQRAAIGTAVGALAGGVIGIRSMMTRVVMSAQ